MVAFPLSCLVCLAAILLFSGVAKMISPLSGRSLLGDAELPTALDAAWLRAVLPWAEVSLAAALVLTSGPWLIVTTALVALMFAVFTVVVARATRAPDPAPCGCFGALSKTPVSWRTVVRNAVFTLVAVLALVLSASGFPGPVLDVPGWVLAAGALPVALLLVTVWSERSGRAPRDPHDVAGVPRLPPRLRGDGPPATTTAGAALPQPSLMPTTAGPPPPDAGASGEEDDYERVPIPYAALRSADGATVTLRGLATARARVLVRVSLTCGWCAPVVERLAELSDRLGPVATHAVVGGDDERGGLPAALRAVALVDARQELDTVFDRPGTPWAVVLGADGLLAGGPVAGAGPVLELLEELAERFGA